MKLIRNIKMTVCLSLAIAIFSSCDDFLDLTPMNEIVKENFWTEKSDVESVVNSCYAGLEENNVLTRMFVWGEMRSDNISSSGATPYADLQILKENIWETSSWVLWESFYQVINRCNTVIHFAPEVAKLDPNYTESEMKATIAEVTALRTLCYFYLLRTFRDIPYITTPSLDDSDVENDYRVPPTPFKKVLAALISDLERVKGDALRLYPDQGYPTYDAANTSRVTTCMIYALLADLYLWDEQYDQCVKYCDLVLEYKMERYEELLEENLTTDLELFKDKYPLLLSQPTGNAMGHSYNQIFGTGNSFESIFELYFLNNQSVANNLIANYYGNNNGNVGNVSASDLLITGVYEGSNDLFKPTDGRVPESIEERGSYNCIRKYVRSNVAYTLGKNNSAPSVSSTLRSTNYSNWIIYRLTDIMLMKAEAEVELAATGQVIAIGSDTIVKDEAARLADAFELVSAVYNRANNLSAASADTLKRSSYEGIANMRELVFAERQRELLFEGKRWFDLVRLSLRLGDNTALIEAVIRKQKESTSAIKIKLHSQDALFFPYAERELDANPHLVQNAAYITNETSSKQ